MLVQVEVMVGKNQALLAEKTELKRKAELADQTEQELAKRSQVFQKTIKNLVSPWLVALRHCAGVPACMSSAVMQDGSQAG